MSQANVYEQYMLELINAERKKVGSQPLAFDSNLNTAAERHSDWMIDNDIFSHTGVNGSNAGTRMKDAGYKFSGSWAWGENIAWRSKSAPSGFQDELQKMHLSLMNSDGHRKNILNNNFKEIGVGVEDGIYKNFDAVFVTQNFAKTASNPFLTGVSFDDANGNLRYDVNEGLAGLTVSARNNSTGTVQTTQTGQAGGYEMELAAGNYTVTFDSPEIEQEVFQVTIGSQNVKIDLVDPVADIPDIPDVPIVGCDGHLVV